MSLELKIYEAKKYEVISFYNREFSGSGFFDWAVISTLNFDRSFIDGIMLVAKNHQEEIMKCLDFVKQEENKYFDFVFHKIKPLFIEIYRQRIFSTEMNPHTDSALRNVSNVIECFSSNPVKPTESILVGYFLSKYGHQFTTSAPVKEWVFWMIQNNDREIYGERKRSKEIVDKEYSNIYNTIMNNGDLFDLANNSPSFKRFRK